MTQVAVMVRKSVHLGGNSQISYTEGFIRLLFQNLATLWQSFSIGKINLFKEVSNGMASGTQVFGRTLPPGMRAPRIGRFTLARLPDML